MKLRAAVLTAVIAAGAAAPAAAAPWKRVTTPDGSSIDQVGLARTADGALHLAWSHPTGPNTEDLLHTVISPGGTIGAGTPIQSGWTGFTNTALVAEPGGLRAFWGGFRTTDSSDPQQEISTALSSDAGASWALMPGPVNPGGGQSYASPIVATVRPGGGTLQAWSGTLGTWVHAGLSPGSPNFNYMEGLQYGNDPNLVTDGSGRSWMAWYSSAASRLGVLAQQVAASGRAGRRAAHDARHRRDDDRHAGPHAAGGARGRRRLHRLSGARRPRTRCACGASAPGTPRSSPASRAAARSRSPPPPTGACGRSGTTAGASTRGSSRAAPTRARPAGAPRSPPGARPARSRRTGSTRARRATRSTCSASSTSARARTRARSTAASSPA